MDESSKWKHRQPNSWNLLLFDENNKINEKKKIPLWHYALNILIPGMLFLQFFLCHEKLSRQVIFKYDKYSKCGKRHENPYIHLVLEFCSGIWKNDAFSNSGISNGMETCGKRAKENGVKKNKEDYRSDEILKYVLCCVLSRTLWSTASGVIGLSVFPLQFLSVSISFHPF